MATYGGDPMNPRDNRDINQPGRRGGTGWGWLLVAVVVALIIWLFVAAGNRSSRASNPNRGTEQSQSATNQNPNPNESQTGSNAGSSGTVITDVAMLSGADAQSLDGRPVNLTAVKVQKVGKDGNFMITDDGGHQVLVVQTAAAAPASAPNDQPDRSANPQQPGYGVKAGAAAGNAGAMGSNAGGATSVRQGDQVNVEGTAQTAPSDKNEQKRLGLPSNAKLYIVASNVTKSNNQ